MMRGNWPRIVQDIKLSDQVFDNHKLIEGIKMEHDGTFTLQLRESVFGASRMLRMTPDAESYEAGNALGIDWICSSNLPVEALPENCTAM